MTGSATPNPQTIIARSMLYVPVLMPKFVEKAHARGADAIILDLEDSIAAARKAEARATLADCLTLLSGRGVDQIFVRINQPLRLAVPDLETAVSPLTCGLVLPKVQSAGHLRIMCEAITELERERGIPVGHTRLAVRIETAEAFAHMGEIAAADPRVAFFGIGAEDFIAALGAEMDPGVLAAPKQMALIAARAAGASPHGLIGATTGLSDLDALRETVARSRRFGFEGAPCVHPAQVPILNQGFGILPADVERSRRVVGAFEAAVAAGLGAAEFEGRMIDAPVAARARNVLDRHDQIRAREERAPERLR